MRFDLHIHSDLSPCSDLSIQEILDCAAARGLDGVCITDHDTMAIRERLDEGVQNNGLVVLFGLEYATPQGDFLLFGPFEEIEPGLTADGLLPQVAARGGAAIAAHPFRANRPTEERVLAEGLCAIAEGINGRNTTLENLKVMSWTDRYQLCLTGGSDAHTPEEVGRIATRFSRPIRHRTDLIAALRAGECHPEWNHTVSRVVGASLGAET